jgi:hypothetical protein
MSWQMMLRELLAQIDRWLTRFDSSSARAFR